MLTTELTNERQECRDDSGYVNKRNQTTSLRTEPAARSSSGACIPHQPNEVEHLWESLLELVPEQNFLLVAFQVEDWNPDFFRLGEAKAVFGKEGFAGQGLKKQLRWLTEECVGHILTGLLA